MQVLSQVELTKLTLHVEVRVIKFVHGVEYVLQQLETVYITVLVTDDEVVV